MLCELPPKLLEPLSSANPLECMEEPLLHLLQGWNVPQIANRAVQIAYKRVQPTMPGVWLSLAWAVRPQLAPVDQVRK